MPDEARPIEMRVSDRRRDRVVRRTGQRYLRRSRPLTPTDATVVHLAAEYGSLAKAGGLAEAVSGLATAQARAGIRTVVLLPLYRSVREAGGLEAIDALFPFTVGRHSGVGRLWRLLPDGGCLEPDVFAVELDGFDRPGIYGEDGLDYPDNSRRFASFVASALVALPRLAPRASVVHAHDWHASLALPALRAWPTDETAFDRVGAVLAVHNAAYQGRFAPSVWADLGFSLPDGMDRDWEGRYAWLELGIEWADHVVTVSATHAQELRTPLGGFGLHRRFEALGDRLTGLTNGIDQERWDPRSDACLAAPFSADSLAGRLECRRALLAEYRLPESDPAPVVGLVARLIEQKGLDLLLDGTVERFPGVRFIVLGRGTRDYEERLLALAARFPDRVRVPLAFSDRAERQLLAGCDLVLIPSLFEPCGLVQMHAQRYGSVPVARRVGGLAETVWDQETGFLFQDYSSASLQEALGRALGALADRPRWEAMMRAGMRADFGWDRSVGAYSDAYRRALRRRDALLTGRPADQSRHAPSFASP
jgi:starch synthase